MTGITYRTTRGPIPRSEWQRWIGDYLRDRLSPGERERFEIAMLGDEALRDEVEAEWLLMRTAKEALRAGAAGTIDLSERLRERDRPGERRDAWFDWRLAAAFVLGIGVATIGTGLLRGPGDETEALLTALPVADVPASRSSDANRDPATITVEGTGATLVRLPAPAGAGPFRARLHDATGTLATVERIGADEAGELLIAVRVPSTARAPVLLAIEAPSGTTWIPVREVQVVRRGPVDRTNG
jgi:hypothetical protein